MVILFIIIILGTGISGLANLYLLKMLRDKEKMLVEANIALTEARKKLQLIRVSVMFSKSLRFSDDRADRQHQLSAQGLLDILNRPQEPSL